MFMIHYVRAREREKDGITATYIAVKVFKRDVVTNTTPKILFMQVKYKNASNFKAYVVNEAMTRLLCFSASLLLCFSAYSFKCFPINLTVQISSVSLT
jgi:predicted neutral ceramidase superfamily lipid hydrolase